MLNLFAILLFFYNSALMSHLFFSPPISNFSKRDPQQHFSPRFSPPPPTTAPPSRLSKDAFSTKLEKLLLFFLFEWDDSSSKK